jgi:TolB-like protein/Flp pilus assembly protein TadD
MSFLAELKRRNVVRVGVAYLVTAWLLLQVADLILNNVSAPAWIMRMLMLAVAAGFPIALLLAWAFELTSDGIKREEDVDPSASRTPQTGKKLDRIIIGVLLLALSVVGVERVFFAGISEPRQIATIAILPFEDMSPLGDQAYLGNGIADELRLELQRLDGLRVAGRMSSIAATQNDDDKTIAEILNVDSILEGSIRKEGTSIRITAQLISAADGFTIWSESYSRELANIFEMQEEIATSVAGALGVRLGVGGINAFKGAGTRNVEAYEAYLRSRRLDYEEALPLLERAIELDPNYAAAWAQLGIRTVATNWTARPDEAVAILKRAFPFALKAVELNPESAIAHSMLAVLRQVQFDWLGAEQGHTRAIELLSDRRIVGNYASMLIRNGRTADAQTQFGIAESLEPLGGRPMGLHWHASLAQGKFAEAKELSEWQNAASRVVNNLDIALNEGDPEGVKAAIRAMPKTNVSAITLHTPVLAEFDSQERVLSILRDVHVDENLHWPRKLHDIAMLAAFFGDPEFALQVKGKEVRASPARLAAVWYPVMSEVRRLPAFKELVAELNLVEYWRTYGWADACHPLGEDDFACL